MTSPGYTDSVLVSNSYFVFQSRFKIPAVTLHSLYLNMLKHDADDGVEDNITVESDYMRLLVLRARKCFGHHGQDPLGVFFTA